MYWIAWQWYEDAAHVFRDHAGVQEVELDEEDEKPDDWLERMRERVCQWIGYGYQYAATVRYKGMDNNDIRHLFEECERGINEILKDKDEHEDREGTIVIDFENLDVTVTLDPKEDDYY